MDADNLFDIGEDLEDEDEIEEEYIGLENSEKLLKEKKTSPVMTTYEKSAIIAERVKQLNNSYKTTIEDIVEKEKLKDSFSIALREFELGKLPPYKIKRQLPDNSYEYWSHEDFKYFP